MIKHSFAIFSFALAIVAAHGADSHTDVPLGTKSPGDSVTATANVPGTVIAGAVSNNGGWPWTQLSLIKYSAIVPASFAGAHTATFAGTYTVPGVSDPGQPLTWDMAATANVLEHVRFPESTVIEYDPAAVDMFADGRGRGDGTKDDAKTFKITYHNNGDKGNYHYQTHGRVDWRANCRAWVSVAWLNPFGRAAAYAYVNGSAPTGEKKAGAAKASSVSYDSGTILSIPYIVPIQTGNGEAVGELEGSPGRIESDPIAHAPTTYITYSKDIVVTATAKAAVRSGGRALATARILSWDATASAADALAFSWDGN